MCGMSVMDLCTKLILEFRELTVIAQQDSCDVSRSWMCGCQGDVVCIVFFETLEGSAGHLCWGLGVSWRWLCC